MLTIFTPTYNREKELSRLYNSLEKQTCKDFEWVIVDDGSSDGTKEVVSEFISTGNVEINYNYQQNSGKMKAHNRGVEKAKGELFVCVDADDWLTEDAVEVILENAERLGKESIGGMILLNYDGDSDKIVGSRLPQDDSVYSYFDIYNKLGVTGDKTIVYLTKVMKDFPFPEIDGEKFVPEALVYNRIAEHYKLLCVDKAIKRVEYLSDGYSNNYFRVCKNNPQAQIIYYKELFQLIPSLYNAAAYDMYCIYARKNVIQAVKDHPNSFISLLMYLPAYIKYLLKEKE
jgi:glycosyltransferase involved in cell wall biosynthesis